MSQQHTSRSALVKICYNIRYAPDWIYIFSRAHLSKIFYNILIYNLANLWIMIQQKD